MITVEGKKYKVIDNLGYVHSRGAYAKIINYNGKGRVVIKIGKSWGFAKPIVRFATPITGM